MRSAPKKRSGTRRDGRTELQVLLDFVRPGDALVIVRSGRGGGIAMPIRPELRPLYPPHWRELSSHVRFERAGGRCQRCGRPHLARLPGQTHDIILFSNGPGFRPS